MGGREVIGGCIWGEKAQRGMGMKVQKKMAMTNDENI